MDNQDVNKCWNDLKSSILKSMHKTYLRFNVTKKRKLNPRGDKKNNEKYQEEI